MKLRSYLIILAVAAALPVLIFAGITTYRSYKQQQAELAQRMIERARAISAALDREFLVSIQSLKVLGGSSSLHKENLAVFYGDMKGALTAYNRAWQNLTLTDPSGQQLINLRRAFGAPLPASGNPEAIERVQRTKEAVIANLSPGPVTGAPGIVVHVPVLSEGEVKYVLNAIFYPAPLTELLLQQDLPKSWFATIIDRNQIVVARTRNGEKFFGKPASPTFAAQAIGKREATWRGTTLEQDKVFAALHRSDFTGWTVGLAMPAAEFDAIVRDSLLLTGAGGAALILAALIFALGLGRRIAAPISALSEGAETLGRGQTPAVAASPIIEVNAVAQAMAEAGKTRHDAEAALRKSAASLAAAEIRAKLGSWELDLKSQAGWWSAEMFRLFDRDPAEGAPPFNEFLDMVDRDDRDAVEETQARALRTGEDSSVEFRITAKDGSERYLHATMRATKAPDGRARQLAGTVQDVTERKKDDARIIQLNRVYSVLSDINQAIVRIRDSRTLLSTACEIAVAKGKFRLAWIGRVNSTTGRMEPRAYAGVNDGFLDKLDIVLGDPSSAADPAAAALLEGAHVVCNDIAGDPRMAPRRDDALRRGYRSLAAFPLRIGAEITGVFNLYSSERGFFSAQELSLLDELAADISLALEINRHESEKLRAENSLRESEERFRQLADNIRGVFWLSTPDKNRIIYVSPGYESIWGRSSQSLYTSPREWIDAVHPDDRGSVLQAALTEQETGAYEREYRIVRPDGTIRWIRDRAFPVRDESGMVYRIAGVAEDITERKQIEVQSQKQRHDLQLLHEISQEILAKDSSELALKDVLAQVLQILIKDRSFDFGSIRVEDSNEKTAVTLVHRGYRNPGQINRSPRIMNRSADAPERTRYRVIETGRARAVADVQSANGLTTLKAEGARSAVIIPLCHDDSSLGILQLASRSARKFDLDEIRFYETIGNSLAVTIHRHGLWEKLKAAKQGLELEVAARTGDLTEANRKLRELDELKSQFLANMSHELRTPLNAIIGFSELMYHGKIAAPVSDEQKEYLGDILSSARHLLQLINDVLDLSKVEAGRMEVLRSSFHVEDVIVELVQNIAPVMSAKSLKLVREIPTDLPTISTDRRKLLQIVLNLASNAVKFTDRGEITIRCEKVDGIIKLGVSDTGIGIKAEQMKNLFQPFSQIDDSVRKRHEGTGLGLYLSRRLAMLLGGDISVVSEYAKGSTFTLSIPIGGEDSSSS